MTLPRPLPRSDLARPVLRALAVLLLLLGVLAMHQLAGGDHMAMSAGTSTSAPQMGAPEPAPDATSTVGRPTPVTARAPAGSTAGSTAGSLAGVPGGHGAMPLCLAVLAGLVAVVLPTLAGARARASVPAGPRVASSRTRAPGRGPPRDLLAQLCVLRT